MADFEVEAADAQVAEAGSEEKAEAMGGPEAPPDDEPTAEAIESAIPDGNHKRKLEDLEVEAADAQVAEAGSEEKAEAMGGPEAPPDDEPTAEAIESAIPDGDHKRKLEDLEPYDDGVEAPLKKQEISIECLAPATAEPKCSDEEVTAGGSVDGSEHEKSDNGESTEPKIELSEIVVSKADDQGLPQDGDINDSVLDKADEELQESETTTVENGAFAPGENAQSTTEPQVNLEKTSRKIEVPNNKVGVLIGKSGETIKYLQLTSGAKIQITRDTEADPHSTTRPLELIGTLESIEKADKLIKDVIAEADAGGSPSLVARGFGTMHSGGEQFEIKVPNEKVGLIIGKGGETIKSLQTRSGARIQLIPQQEGDASNERTLRVTGDKKQIESAKDMIMDAMNQAPRPSPLSGYSQQNYRPRGPNTQTNWGTRATLRTQQPSMGYDYHQRGTYSHPAKYSQPYGGYSQQPAPRGGISNIGWDQRSAAPIHNTQTSGYNYYGQGGQATGTQASMPTSISGPSPAPSNYGQPQAPNYGHPTPYGQPAPTHQNYSQGYNEPRYDSQTSSQQFYGQQTMGSQQGMYGQAPQLQQPYNKPAYGAVHEPSYGVPPRANQPGDPTYQSQTPSSYGSGTQHYPYGSNGPSQPQASYNQTYGSGSGVADGYTQPPPTAYTQHGGQTVAPGYGQSGPVTAYTQPTSQPVGYGQYPAPQQSYVDPALSSVHYGYPGGSADAAYGSTYGAQPATNSQPGYPQQPSNPTGYY